MDDLRNVLLAIAAIVAGLAVGVGVTYGVTFLAFISSVAFAQFHPQAGYAEFGTSIGQDAYFLCLALGVAIGAIALLRRRMPVLARLFFVSAAVPLLGFFALCSVVSISDLINVPHR